MKPKLTKTRAEYAKQYDRNARTITRWIAKGYPLDDPEKVARLESAQKNSRRSADDADAVEVDATTLTDEQLGNPPTLAHAKLYELILICRRLAFNNAKERDLYALKSEVITRITTLVRGQCMDLRRIFEREQPPMQEGLDAAHIQRMNQDALNKLFTEYHNRGKALQIRDSRGEE